MKQIIIIIIVSLLVAGCDSPGREIDPYHPTRPKDIPVTMCDGTPIEWNWEKQRSYNEGKLFVEKDSNGCVLLIIRKIK
jgi:uncharacterized protein YceK